MSCSFSLPLPDSPHHVLSEAPFPDPLVFQLLRRHHLAGHWRAAWGCLPSKELRRDYGLP